jgi:cell fate regulator YaaT (PSP1 superfamily)
MVYLQPEDGPLLTIARKATASDFGRWQQNQELEEQAFALARGKTREQALPISAEGLAGACGRLRCCLRYEYEQYRQVNRLLPRTNEEVGTPKGRATVIVGHRIRETVSVRYPDDQVLEWPLAQIQRFPPSKN